MSTVTLGFEDDTNLSKSEIAETQIVEAISLFLAGKYLCAITLAGAAEAIFAGMLAQRGETSAVEDSVGSIQRIRDCTGLSVMDGKRDSELFKDWNGARNKLKHHGTNEDARVTLNLFDEAYWMIKRAAYNAEKLAVPIVNRDGFENWIIQNVNM